MRIDESSTASKTKPAEGRHLRAVPSKPATSSAPSSTAQAEAPRRAASPSPTSPRDRFSDSGERDDDASERVSNIVRGLFGDDNRNAESQGAENGEGLDDIAGDVYGGARRAAGGLKDKVGDVVDGGRDLAGDLKDKVSDLTRAGRGFADDRLGDLKDTVGGLKDKAGDVIDNAGDFLDKLFGGEHDRQDDSLAEDREEGASVAVIDYFAEDGKEPAHGDIVESIIQDNSGLTQEDIQRYKAGGGGNIDELTSASPEEFGEKFDSYIEDRVTGLLDGSSNAIEDILSDENSSIRTINQSLGVPESRIAQDIAGKMKSDPAFRERFLEYAGLEADADQREVMQALVDEVGDSRRSNETIAESKERYDNLVRDAYDRGITTTDSSGNYGSFARELDALGVKTDDQFHTDVLNNPLVLSVGGTNSNGTETLSDDQVSSFSSPNAGTDISAQGTSVMTTIDGKSVGGDGTSFAAPQATAAAAVLAQKYPELSPAEIRYILQRTALNPGLDGDLVGAGILQQDSALALAEQIAA